jgi:hypothetical protein
MKEISDKEKKIYLKFCDWDIGPKNYYSGPAYYIHPDTTKFMFIDNAFNYQMQLDGHDEISK